MSAIDEATRTGLAAAWKGVATKSADPNTKALAFKGNYRVKLSSAFAAAFHSAIAVLKGAELAHANPLAIFELGADVFAAVVAVMDAVRERLMPAEFILCLALSHAPSGEPELEKTVREFLGADPRLFPWYLGIDAKLLEKARQQLDSAEDFGDIVAKLMKDGRIARDEGTGTLRFIERNVDLSLNLGAAG
jgi:hypothetical protein